MADTRPLLPRPVDSLAIPQRLGWRMNRLEAGAAQRCVRCASDCSRLTGMDRDEWRVSALCPDCWDAVTGPEE